MTSYRYLFKIIVVGDSGVGKSCLQIKFTENRFVSYHDATADKEIYTKNIKIDEKDFRLQIWDTAGQESHRSIARSYFRGAAGVLLVYDVTNRTSFNNVSSWLKDIRENSEAATPITLVGTKTDLTEKRVITTEEGSNFAQQNNLLFIETSSKKGENVTETFHNLAAKIYAAYKAGDLKVSTEGGIKLGQDATPNLNGTSANAEPANQSSSGCC